MLQGFIYSKFESGKPYQTPSNVGELNYGTFHLLGELPKNGSDPDVIKFLKKSEYWQTHFSSLMSSDVNSESFNDKWRELGKTDPLFDAAQYKYIIEEHFYPLAHYAERKGFPRSKAIDEALFSISVQRRYAKNICDRVASILNLKNSTEADIIQALYHARTAVAEELIESGVGVGQDLRNLIEKIYPAEEHDIINLIKNPETLPPSFQSVFEQLGLSLNDARVAAQAAKAKNKFTPEELSKNLEEIFSWRHENQILTTLGPDACYEDDKENESYGKTPSISITSSSSLFPSDGLSSEEIKKLKFQRIMKFLDFIEEVGVEIKMDNLISIVNAIKGIMRLTVVMDDLFNAVRAKELNADVMSPASHRAAAAYEFVNSRAVRMSSDSKASVEALLVLIRGLQEENNSLKKELAQKFSDLEVSIAQKFVELFKRNQEIFDAIQNVIYVVNDQVGSLRVEIAQYLNNTLKGIYYLTAVATSIAQSAALKDLRYFSTHADRMMEPGAKEKDLEKLIDDIKNNLYFWGSSEAGNSLYTGEAYFSSIQPPPGFLASILEERDGSSLIALSVLANTFIAYLANYYHSYRMEYTRDTYYQEKKISTDSEKVPNLQIWHDAAHRYFSLMSIFIRFDEDDKNSEADKIMKLGTNFIQLVNAIENDSLFWESLCNHYNNLVIKLESNQSEYIESYSDIFKVELQNPKLPNNSIDNGSDNFADKWNFLMQPERFVALMEGRDSREMSFDNSIDIKNIQPLFEGLKAVDPFFTKQYAVAIEYLKLAHFSAKQVGDIPLPYCLSPILGTDLAEVNAKLIARGSSGSKDMWEGSINAIAGMEVFRKNNGSNERVIEWTLPIQLSVTRMMDNKKIDFARSDAHGSYSRLAISTKFNVLPGLERVDDPNIYENFNERQNHPLVTGLIKRRISSQDGWAIFRITQYTTHPRPDFPGFYGHDLLAAIPDYVKNMWEHANDAYVGNNPYDVTFNNVQLLINSQALNDLKGLIDNYFLAHRKKIAAILDTGIDDLQGIGSTMTSRQTFLNNYKNTLTELDIHVRLMQLFCYLIGKDARHSFFDTLGTSTTAQLQLKQFNQNPTINTPLALHFEPIHKNDLMNLPDLDEAQVQQFSHPRGLFKRVVLANEAYRNIKKIFNALPSKPEMTTIPLHSSSNDENSAKESKEFAATTREKYSQQSSSLFKVTNVPADVMKIKGIKF